MEKARSAPLWPAPPARSRFGRLEKDRFEAGKELVPESYELVFANKDRGSFS